MASPRDHTLSHLMNQNWRVFDVAIDTKALPGLSLDELLDVWAVAQDQARDAAIWRHEVEKHIEARMGSARQEAAETTEATASFKAGYEWDRDRLQAIKEYVSEAEWDGLLTDQRPAPPRYPDARKAQRLGKERGDPIRKIVEAARIALPPKLAIKRQHKPKGEVPV